jgi:hypothetical protein
VTDVVKTALTYKFQPTGVRMIRKILADVKVVHHRVKEGERMARGRIDAEKWDDVRVRKLTGCPGLLQQSLRVRCQYCFNRANERTLTIPTSAGSNSGEE